MEKWVSVTDALPESEEWTQVMTQDGTVYPAIYKKNAKIWSPLFRGGEIAQLYHGNVRFWQPHAEGYEMLNCPECGRQYLKTPHTDSCPICTAFKSSMSKPKEATIKAPDEVPAADEAQKPAVRRGGRKKKEE